MKPALGRRRQKTRVDLAMQEAKHDQSVEIADKVRLVLAQLEELMMPVGLPNHGDEPAKACIIVG